MQARHMRAQILSTRARALPGEGRQDRQFSRCPRSPGASLRRQLQHRVQRHFPPEYRVQDKPPKRQALKQAPGMPRLGPGTQDSVYTCGPRVEKAGVPAGRTAESQEQGPGASPRAPASLGYWATCLRCPWLPLCQPPVVARSHSQASPRWAGPKLHPGPPAPYLCCPLAGKASPTGAHR